MAKKRKHHNLRKRQQLNTKGYRLEHKESWSEPGKLPVVKAFIDHPLLGQIQVGTKMTDAARNIARLWKITIFVECKAPDGSTYIEEREFDSPICKLEQVTEVFQFAKKDCLAAVNSQHIVDTGFVAVALT